MMESAPEREARATQTGVPTNSDQTLSKDEPHGERHEQAASSDTEIAGIDAQVLLGDTVKIESSTPGGFLRQTREQQERALQQVADELHLSRSSIEAIEGNRFTEFGAPVFAKGHLRRYAALLQVPVDDVLTRYEQLSDSARAHESLPPAARTNDPARRVELTREAHLRIAPRPTGSGFRWLPVVMIVALLIACGVGAWWWLNMRQPAASPFAIQQSTTVDFATDLSDERADGVVNEAIASLAEQSPAPAVAPVATAPVPAAVIEQRTPASTSPLPGKVRLRLIFKQDSWAEVYDGRGNRMMYDVGRSDLPRVIDADPPMQVVLGFAPAVDVEINGVAKAVPERFVNNSVARFAVHADGRMQ